MKILFLLPILLLFIVNITQAKTLVDEKSQGSFSINVSDITYYKDIKSTQFTLNIEDIKNLQNISYWKISAYCDKKMTIQLNPTDPDICIKPIRIKDISNNKISFLFKNKTSQSKDFSLKIKAFDKNGKGLYGESVGFGWK